MQVLLEHVLGASTLPPTYGARNMVGRMEGIVEILVREGLGVKAEDKEASMRSLRTEMGGEGRGMIYLSGCRD